MDEQKFQQMLDAQQKTTQEFVVATLASYKEETKTYVDTALATNKEESQRYMGILLEHFDDKIKVVAEVVGMMNERLTTVAEGVVELKDRMDVVETKVDVLTERVDVLTERVDAVEVTLTEVSADVKEVKQGMKSKVDIGAHLALEHRVHQLEHV